jgi:hypothetical protein
LTDALTSVALAEEKHTVRHRVQEDPGGASGHHEGEAGERCVSQSCHGIGSLANKYSLAAAAKEGGGGDAAAGKKK